LGSFLFAYLCKPIVGLSLAGGCRQLAECWFLTFPVSVPEMTNVGISCQLLAGCRWKVLEVLCSTSIKEHAFSSFSHLKTGARTGYISTTMNNTVHTRIQHSLLSLPDFIL